MSVRDYLEHRPQIGSEVFVDPTALVIGQVTLGDDVSIWPMAVVRGDVNAIEIGARSNIQDACVLHVTHDGPFSPGGFPLKIGEDVTVGHRVTLHACAARARGANRLRARMCHRQSLPRGHVGDRDGWRDTRRRSAACCRQSGATWQAPRRWLPLSGQSGQESTRSRRQGTQNAGLLRGKLCAAQEPLPFGINFSRVVST